MHTSTINKYSVLPQESDCTVVEEATSSEKKKRVDIQSLRGIAIISVVLFHLFPNAFPKGFLGVDVFFVISGFLITMILSKRAPISLSDTATFFSKRIRRIFPAYYMMILVVLAFGLILLIPSDQDILIADSKWAMVFASNIHKYLQKRDYFAQMANYDFLLHAWSLAVEIQFYCIAPLLALIGHRFRMGGFMLGVIAVLSIGFHVGTQGELRFSSLPSRLWQFMAGGLAFCSQQYSTALPVAVRRSVTLLAMIGLSPLVLFPSGHDMECRFLVTLAATVIIARFSPSDNDFFLESPVLMLVGDISYSLYLAHWPVIMFFKYYLNQFSLTVAYSILAVQLSVVIAFSSYHKIEKYFIKKNLGMTLLFILLLICCSTATLYCPIWLSSNGSNSGAQVNVSMDSSSGSLQSRPQNTTRFVQKCFEFRNVDYRPRNVTTAMIKSGIEVNSNRFMHYWPKEVPNDSLPDPLYKKYFTNKKFEIVFNAYYKGPGKAKVVVMGNSFAHRALQAIKRAYGERFGEIRLLSHIGCPPFIGTEYPSEPCLRFQNVSYELIEEMKPHAVFLIFRPFEAIDDPIVDISTDSQLKLMQNSIDRLSAVSGRIVLEYPLPFDTARFPTPLLLQALRSQKVSFEDVKTDYTTFYKLNEHLMKRLDSIKCTKCDRIYPHRIFCDYKVCRVFDPDNLYSFFDMGLHYSDYAMECIWRLYADVAEEQYANGLF